MTIRLGNLLHVHTVVEPERFFSGVLNQDVAGLDRVETLWIVHVVGRNDFPTKSLGKLIGNQNSSSLLSRKLKYLEGL